MSDDLVSLASILLGLFVIGYASGFMVYSMRRFLESI